MDCPNSVIEVVRSDGQKVNTIVGDVSVTFMNPTSTLGDCTVSAVLNSGVRVNIGSFSCHIGKFIHIVFPILRGFYDAYHGFPVDIVHV